MSSCKVILMYSEAHNTDMWWVEHHEDLYGPFFEKAMAQSFLDDQFTDEVSRNHSGTVEAMQKEIDELKEVLKSLYPTIRSEWKMGDLDYALWKRYNTQIGNGDV